MLLAMSSLLPAVSAPSAEVLASEWARDQAARDAHAAIRVSLTSEDLTTLADGELVRRMVPVGDAATVVGVKWMAVKPIHVWIAIQDIEDRPLNNDQAVTTRLPQDTLVRRMNYNVIKAPWPIADRQSVVSVTANTTLWQATDKKIWERSLKLEDSSLAVTAEPDAIWLPRLGGGFHIVEATGGCIVIFQIDADPGGSIPEDLVNRFAWMGLNNTMATLVRYASEVPAHYAGGHVSIALPDGSLIPTGSL